jgi:ribosomal protein L35
MTIIKSIYCSAWQQLRDKLQASTGGRKHINTEKVNKNKNEEKYTKYIIIKSCIRVKQGLKYYLYLRRWQHKHIEQKDSVY